MSDVERSRLEQQLDELALLQSVFSEPGEFLLDDQAVYDHATAFVRQLTNDVPHRLSCSLHLEVEVDLGHENEEATACASSDQRTHCNVVITMRLPHRCLILS